MLKRTLTAVALATVLAAPAFAQTAKPGSMLSSTPAPATGGFVQSQNATDARGSKLIGASVYGPDNASIGEINDVLIGKDGKVSAVVIGVGGFVGVGEKNVAIPFDALSVSRKPSSDSIDKVAVSYSKEQLKSAPKFTYFDPASSSTTGSSPLSDSSKK